MTFGDLDTWRVISNQFVGVDSKSGISVALNSNSQIQDSCKVRIITAEMSYGNGPWYSSVVTFRGLDPRKLYMGRRYP